MRSAGQYYNSKTVHQEKKKIFRKWKGYSARKLNNCQAPVVEFKGREMMLPIPCLLKWHT